MNHPPLPEAGEVVHGKYLIHRLLGRGGVGVVFEAEHLRLRQRVAIKMLAPEMLAHPEMVERFEREARAMAVLASAHVTRVIDVDATVHGIPFLVMEFLHGRDLQHELKERGALSVGEAVHWVRQACAGMVAVHAAGIVHRDLKPANLFLVDTAEGRFLKIMDFGISKMSGEDHDVTMTVTTLGTPAYMSPEQVRSAKHIDVRADVWSLGVILYRALTGKLPFNGSGSTGMAVAIVNDEPTPVEAHRPDLPPALVTVVRRALAKNPEQRLPSVAALSMALSPFDGVASFAPANAVREQENVGPSLAGQSLHSSPELAKPRTSRLPLLIAMGLAALGALGAVVVFATREDPAKTEKTEAPPPKQKVATPKPEPVEVAPQIDETKPAPPPPVIPPQAVSPSAAPPSVPPSVPSSAPTSAPVAPAKPAPKPAKPEPKPTASQMPVLL